MNREDATRTIVAVLVLLVIMFGAFLFVRYLSTSYSIMDYRSYCEYRFGQGYYAQKGDCGTLLDCVIECRKAIVNETSGEVEVIKKYFVRNQLERDCKHPRFWRLTQWSLECGGGK